MIRAIIYDLDGTILNSTSVGFNRFFDIAREFGLPCEGKETLARSRWGNSASEVIHACWPNADAETFLERWKFLDRTEPVPLIVGAREALAYFHGKGIIQGILTNRDGVGARHQVGYYGLKDFFAIVSGHETSKYPKPDPRSADAIFVRFAELGVSNREDIAFVGDGLADFECARNLKMQFIGVLSGQATIDTFIQAGLDSAHILPSIADLPKYLDV